jgi:hypothetical protein
MSAETLFEVLGVRPDPDDDDGMLVKMRPVRPDGGATGRKAIAVEIPMTLEDLIQMILEDKITEDPRLQELQETVKRLVEGHALH